MRLREALSLLWVIPPMALGAMWVRSVHQMDEVAGVDAGNVLRGVVSYQRAMHFIRSEQNSTPRKVAWDAYDVPEKATWANLYPAVDKQWRWMGFGKFAASRPGPPGAAAGPPAALRTAVVSPQRSGNGVAVRTVPATRPGGAGVAVLAIPPARPRLMAPWLFSRRYTAYAVPYWAPLAVTVVPALLVITRLVRRATRLRKGLCPGCGYDLRMTADRCPECGEPVARRRSVAA